MVAQGPGTIWETWDDSSNSHNHPALAASIGVYLYAAAGLEQHNENVSNELDGVYRRRGVVPWR